MPMSNYRHAKGVKGTNKWSGFVKGQRASLILPFLSRYQLDLLTTEDAIEAV